jgi:hypothetical protein
MIVSRSNLSSFSFIFYGAAWDVFAASSRESALYSCIPYKNESQMAKNPETTRNAQRNKDIAAT